MWWLDKNICYIFEFSCGKYKLLITQIVLHSLHTYLTMHSVSRMQFTPRYGMQNAFAMFAISKYTQDINCIRYSHRQSINLTMAVCAARRIIDLYITTRYVLNIHDSHRKPNLFRYIKIWKILISMSETSKE